MKRTKKEWQEGNYRITCAGNRVFLEKDNNYFGESEVNKVFNLLDKDFLVDDENNNLYELNFWTEHWNDTDFYFNSDEEVFVCEGKMYRYYLVG